MISIKNEKTGGLFYGSKSDKNTVYAGRCTAFCFCRDCRQLFPWKFSTALRTIPGSSRRLSRYPDRIPAHGRSAEYFPYIPEELFSVLLLRQHRGGWSARPAAEYCSHGSKSCRDVLLPARRRSVHAPDSRCVWWSDRILPAWNGSRTVSLPEIRSRSLRYRSKCSAYRTPAQNNRSLSFPPE